MAPLTRNQQAARQANDSSSQMHKTFHQHAPHPQEEIRPASSGIDSQIRLFNSSSFDNQASYENSIDISQSHSSLTALRRGSQSLQEQSYELTQIAQLGRGVIGNGNCNGIAGSMIAGQPQHTSIAWNAMGTPGDVGGSNYSQLQGIMQEQASPYLDPRPYEARQAQSQIFWVNPFNNAAAAAGQIGFHQVWRGATQAQGNQHNTSNPISPTMPIPATPMRGDDYVMQPHSNQIRSLSRERWAGIKGQQEGGCIPMERLHVYPDELHGHKVTSGDHTEAICGLQQENSYQNTPSSIDQADSQKSNSHDGFVHMRGGIADAFSNNIRTRIISQSSSLCSTAPSEHSIVSTHYVTSPHASIFSKRNGGESSIDTSFESISNSAASLSVDLSRSSSTSDDLVSIGGLSTTSKKSGVVKGKTKLRNIDRKLICEAANANPACRQEDLAARFGIERSTVSKTLKNRDKWLSVKEESGGAMIIKHRSGKFPHLEEALVNWAKEEIQKNGILLDVTIRKRALEVAKEYGLSIDDFKASIGWIDKFRERHGFPKQSYISTLTDTVASSSLLNAEKAIDLKAESGMQNSTPRRSSSRLRGISTMPQDSSEEGETSLESVQEEDASQEGFLDQSLPIENRHPRSQPSSSSTSTEEGLHDTAKTYETPKAVKRHYDEIVDQIDVSINARLSKMQVKQESIERGPHGHDDKDSNGVPQSEKGSSLEPTKTTKKAIAKRRKAEKKESLPSSGQVEGRKRKPRAKPKSSPSTNEAQNVEAKASTSAALLPRSQLPHFDVSTIAPSLLIHRSMTSSESLPRTMESARPVLTRTASGPAARIVPSNSPAMRTSKSCSRPSPAVEQHGGEEETQVLSSLGGYSLPCPLPQDRGNTTRQVTLGEAKASLDVILTFLRSQSGSLGPNDYLVLGNLQRTLGALTEQEQGQSHC